MLFGHKDKIKLFKDLAERERLSHAYLFYGDQQIGKLLFAKHLAYFFEFGNFNFSPEKPLIDAVFTVPGEGGTIGVDEIRALKRNLSQKPLKSKKRIIVINKAEKLTPEAQNSCLKFVEEPPDYAVIIFIANNPDSLLPTILSRLTKIYFRRLSAGEIKKILEREFAIPENKAEKHSKNSFGRLGLALELAGINLPDDNPEGDDEGLDGYLEKAILKLYTEDKLKNYQKISALL